MNVRRLIFFSAVSPTSPHPHAPSAPFVYICFFHTPECKCECKEGGADPESDQPPPPHSSHAPIESTRRRRYDNKIPAMYKSSARIFVRVFFFFQKAPPPTPTPCNLCSRILGPPDDDDDVSSVCSGASAADALGLHGRLGPDHPGPGYPLGYESMHLHLNAFKFFIICITFCVLYYIPHYFYYF